MCGILGEINLTNIDENNFNEMLKSIKHRGPDDSGNYFENKLALGQNRLSIQDLSSVGHQPMWDSKKEICIVFNGEIYNFKDIKKELKEFEFKSKTDSEVLIYAYKKWGIKKTLEKCRGMFAFCIYDKIKKKLFIIRDRLGVKPLVYYYDKENFIFSSELKAIIKSKKIKKEINSDAIIDYFLYRYIPNPKTILKNTFKLEPGHYLTLDIKSLKLNKHKYWELNTKRTLKLSKKDIINKTKKLLNDAIEYRLISDTKVGSFLSGGIDSSIISTIANNKNPKLKTFSIDLAPKKYSEIEYAKLLVKTNNLKFKYKTVGENEFKKNIDKILKFYDEPMADSSIVPTFILCDFVKNNNYKCILSGDGADELFYGYEWYNTYNILNKINNILPNKFISKIKINKIQRIHKLNKLNEFEKYRQIMFDRFTVKEINYLFNLKSKKNNEYLLKEKLKSQLSEKNINELDLKTYLVDDILYKVDIASMANSIEIRSPYLDHKLVEFLFQIEFNKLYNGKLKNILKNIGKKIIPKKIISRKKKGFSAPVMKWIDKNFKNELINGNMVKNNFITKIKMNEFLKKEKNEGKIWQMYIFEKWYTNYFKK